MQPILEIGWYSGERPFNRVLGGVSVEDKDIVSLFWKKDENAIIEAEKKYGKYCQSIAYNILSNTQDAEECVNDTWVNAWNSIPPHSPSVLSAYLGKLTRFASLKKWRDLRRKKRGGGEVNLVYDELSECLSLTTSIDEEVEAKELAGIINSFLEGLPQIEQKVFICRYWYFDSILHISKQFGFSKSKVKSMLFRMRQKLLLKLQEDGVIVESKSVD